MAGNSEGSPETKVLFAGWEVLAKPPAKIRCLADIDVLATQFQPIIHLAVGDDDSPGSVGRCDVDDEMGLTCHRRLAHP